MNCNRLAVQLVSLSAKDTVLKPGSHNREINARLKLEFDCSDEPASELIQTSAGLDILNAFQRAAKSNKAGTKNTHRYAMRVDAAPHELFLLVENNAKARASCVGATRSLDLVVVDECVSIVVVFDTRVSKETFANMATYLKRTDIVATLTEAQRSLLDSSSLNMSSAAKTTESEAGDEAGEYIN